MDAAEIASRLWNHLAPIVSPGGEYVARARPPLALGEASFVPHLAIWKTRRTEGRALESLRPDVAVIVEFDLSSTREAIDALDEGQRVPGITWWVVRKCFVQVLESVPGGQLVYREATASVHAGQLPPFFAAVDLRPLWDVFVPKPKPIGNLGLSFLGLLTQCFQTNEGVDGFVQRQVGFESPAVACERFVAYLRDAERLFGPPRGCSEAPGIHRVWWDGLRLQRCGRMIHAAVADECIHDWWDREDVWRAPTLAWDEPIPHFGS